MNYAADLATTPYHVHRYPTEYIEALSLPDSRCATLRPVLPQDASLLQAFVAGLSAASRRYRFHGAISGLSAARAQQMARIDYRNQLAMVVVARSEHDGDEEVVADARYAVAADGRTAEFAIVVADGWQGLGLGALLVEAVARAAREAGLHTLSGDVLASNAAMLALMSRCGFRAMAHADGGALVRVERDLMNPTPRAAARPRSLLARMAGALSQFRAPVSSERYFATW